MKNIIYIAASLDGYIAAEDGGVEWLTEIPNPENSDYGFSAFMESIDALVMGRNTFETVLSFGEWPYRNKVFVLSEKLKSLPDHLSDHAEIISGSLKDVLDVLHKRGFMNLYIDGGKTVQSFLKQDLIDEMIISTIPVLLGSGIPLFGTMEKSLSFKLIRSEKISAYIIKNHYKRERGTHES